MHINYSKNHYSTLMLTYYLYLSTPPTLARIIAKGSTSSINSPLDVSKLHKNCLDLSSTGSFPFQCQWTRILKSLTTSITMGTQLVLVRRRESQYSFQCSRKLFFSTLSSVIIFKGCHFPHATIMGAWVAHKRHLGHNYSYHRIQNAYKLFQKPLFDTNVDLLFILVNPSNTRPYHC